MTGVLVIPFKPVCVTDSGIVVSPGPSKLVFQASVPVAELNA